MNWSVLPRTLGSNTFTACGSSAWCSKSLLPTNTNPAASTSFVTVSEYAEKAEMIRKLAAEAGREIDEEHFGALVPYLPEGAGHEEELLRFVAARRPGVEPQDMVVIGDRDALRARLEAFLEQGASKFVLTPMLAPPEWTDELSSLRSAVAALEN